MAVGILGSRRDNDRVLLAVENPEGCSRQRASFHVILFVLQQLDGKQFAAAGSAGGDINVFLRRHHKIAVQIGFVPNLNHVLTTLDDITVVADDDLFIIRHFEGTHIARIIVFHRVGSVLDIINRHANRIINDRQTGGEGIR